MSMRIIFAESNFVNERKDRLNPHVVPCLSHNEGAHHDKRNRPRTIFDKREDMDPAWMQHPDAVKWASFQEATRTAAQQLQQYSPPPQDIFNPLLPSRSSLLSHPAQHATAQRAIPGTPTLPSPQTRGSRKPFLAETSTPSSSAAARSSETEQPDPTSDDGFTKVAHRSKNKRPKPAVEYFNFTNSYVKMKVKVAAQLSSSVASAIEAFVTFANVLPAEAIYTAEFVHLIDELFDSLNSSNPQVLNHKRLKCALTPNSPHLEFWSKLLIKMDQWKLIDLKTGADITNRIESANENATGRREQSTQPNSNAPQSEQVTIEETLAAA
ncbi:hypothetical protein ILUMI_24671, partial [Ignelater luminosus]